MESFHNMVIDIKMVKFVSFFMNRDLQWVLKWLYKWTMEFDQGSFDEMVTLVEIPGKLSSSEVLLPWNISFIYTLLQGPTISEPYYQNFILRACFVRLWVPRFPYFQVYLCFIFHSSIHHDLSLLHFISSESDSSTLGLQ